MRRDRVANCKIFISHAAADEPIIAAFVDLLQTALNIRQDEIFCTSVPGLGVRGGHNFIEDIKSHIVESTVVIAFLSKNYFVSQFCMSEMGAAWVMAKEFFPLKDPSLDYSDARGVLVGSHILKIEDQDDMNSFAEDIINILDTGASSTRSAHKIREFIDKYEELSSSVAAPFNITEREWKQTNKELTLLQDESVKFDAQVEEFNNIIEGLKKCKDKEDVEEVISSFSDDQQKDTFLQRVQLIKDNDTFQNEISKYISYQYLSLPYSPDFDYYSTEYDNAFSRGYLNNSDGDISINENNRKVIPFIDSIKKLSEFMASASADLTTWFEEEYDLDFSLNADFLEALLDVN